jgi:hypothetical protein
VAAVVVASHPLSRSSTSRPLLMLSPHSRGCWFEMYPPPSLRFLTTTSAGVAIIAAAGVVAETVSGKQAAAFETCGSECIPQGVPLFEVFAVTITLAVGISLLLPVVQGGETRKDGGEK